MKIAHLKSKAYLPSIRRRPAHFAQRSLVWIYPAGSLGKENHLSPWPPCALVFQPDKVTPLLEKSSPQLLSVQLCLKHFQFTYHLRRRSGTRRDSTILPISFTCTSIKMNLHNFHEVEGNLRIPIEALAHILSRSNLLKPFLSRLHWMSR